MNQTTLTIKASPMIKNNDLTCNLPIGNNEIIISIANELLVSILNIIEKAHRCWRDSQYKIHLLCCVLLQFFIHLKL